MGILTPQSTGSNLLNAVQGLLQEGIAIGELSDDSIGALLIENSTEWDNLILDINEDLRNPSSGTDPIFQSVMRAFLRILLDFLHDQKTFTPEEINKVEIGYKAIILAIQTNGDDFMKPTTGDKLRAAERTWNLLRIDLNTKAAEISLSPTVDQVISETSGSVNQLRLAA